MKKTQKEPAQSKAFIEAARALECDESEERFDAALKKVARHKTLPTRQDATDADKDPGDNKPS